MNWNRFRLGKTLALVLLGLAGLSATRSAVAAVDFIDLKDPSGNVIVRLDESGNLTLMGDLVQNAGTLAANPAAREAYLKSSGNQIVAIFPLEGSQAGGLKIKGALYAPGTPSPSHRTAFSNSVGTVVASLDDGGNLYLLGCLSTLRAPGDLTAAPASSHGITLNWARMSANEDGFMIERSPSQTGDWAQIAITTVTHHIDATGLSTATRYDYRVRAYKGMSNSEYGAIVSAWTLTDAPVGRAETLSNHGVRLSWTAVTGAVGGYRVYRNEAPLTTATLLGTANVLTYDDLTCPAEATGYWYRVTALGEGGESGFSEAFLGWSAPNPPSGLVVRADDATSPTHSMLLTFTDNSAKESGFIVERSPNGADGWTSTTIGASSGVGGVVNYHDGNGISEGRHYWYRVKARLDVAQ